MNRQRIDIRPLTILAGRNSSGKSSMMQPLLLMKQTLESEVDPGALRLDGPNVHFILADQLFSHSPAKGTASKMTVEIGIDANRSISTTFRRRRPRGVDLRSMTAKEGPRSVTLRLGMGRDDVRMSVPPEIRRAAPQHVLRRGDHHWAILRDRCFFEWSLYWMRGRKTRQYRWIYPFPAEMAASLVRGIIHVPGLRGNPELTYPVSAVGYTFPGTFEKYVASILNDWVATKSSSELRDLRSDLRSLGLTWKIEPVPIRGNDVQTAIHVGRTLQPSQGGARDLVNIAHVGFGTSQAVPVIVALHAAEEGQLVYVEQPEIHLHPKAQEEMAGVLARAVERGVDVVVETHSHLLVLAIQTLVARRKLSPDKVAMHWFEQDKQGMTKVTSARITKHGRTPGWPDDFGPGLMSLQRRFLDATQSRRRR